MSEHAILDTISLIVWALMLVVTVKYVLIIIMRAENRSESRAARAPPPGLRKHQQPRKTVFLDHGSRHGRPRAVYGDGVIRSAARANSLAAILTPMRYTFRRSTVSPPVRGTSPRSMHPRSGLCRRSDAREFGLRSGKLFVLRGGVAAGDAEGPSAPGRLGQRVFVIGEEPALANLLKLAANVLTATTSSAWARCWPLMRKGGLTAHLAFEVSPTPLPTLAGP